MYHGSVIPAQIKKKKKKKIYTTALRVNYWQKMEEFLLFGRTMKLHAEKHLLDCTCHDL